jgi:hypothetical protein
MDLFLQSAQAAIPPLRRNPSTASEVSLATSQKALADALNNVNGPLRTQFAKLNDSLLELRKVLREDSNNFNSIRRESLVPNQSKTLDNLIGSGYDKYDRMVGGFTRKQLTKIILDKNDVIGDLEEEAYKSAGRKKKGFSHKQLTKIILDKNKVIGDLEEEAYRLRGGVFTHEENRFAYNSGISRYI